MLLFLKKVLVLVVVFFALCVGCLPDISPHFSYAQDNCVESKTEIVLAPEIKIDDRAWLNRNKWWVLLGTAIFGGTVAAVSSLGDSSDDTKENGDGQATYVNTW